MGYDLTRSRSHESQYDETKILSQYEESREFRRTALPNSKYLYFSNCHVNAAGY
jgi:hypothetical protein